MLLFIFFASCFLFNCMNIISGDQLFLLYIETIQGWICGIAVLCKIVAF